MDNSNVRRIDGEPNRFFVKSGDPKNDTEYLVDMDEHGGNGQCGCSSFSYRCVSVLAGNTKGDPQCKHIHAVKAFVINEKVIR